MHAESQRSRGWSEKLEPRYWWHRLPGNDFVPPIYSHLDDGEWDTLREWYEETDRDGRFGECAVPLISFLHGLVMGNRVRRIVQLGTCNGYSALLLGFMLRRMGAARALFTLDNHEEMCAISRRWLARAGLENFVTVAQLDSTDPAAPWQANEYLEGAPALIILDTSHQYRATLRELELWYPALATGGLLLLHDVSQFAREFDVRQEGGVRQAFDEWRKAHPEAETFLLNGEARSMADPRPLYQDACGLGFIHKPGIRGPVK